MTGGPCTGGVRMHDDKGIFPEKVINNLHEYGRYYKGLTRVACNRPDIMTSSNGNIFRVAGPLCGKFTASRWIPAQRPVARSFDFSLICARINGWVYNCEAGDSRTIRGIYVWLLPASWRPSSITIISMNWLQHSRHNESRKQIGIICVLLWYISARYWLSFLVR